VDVLLTVAPVNRLPMLAESVSAHSGGRNFKKE
jgi:hypothetical protein